MRIFKLFILWLIVTFVMVISWPIGTMVGNAITGSAPPPQPANAAEAGLIFLAVCAFNSLLITILLHATCERAGRRRSIVLASYLFVLQFLLPQMESYFFASGMGMSYAQITAILIAGIIVSVGTIFLASFIQAKFKLSNQSSEPLVVNFDYKRAGVLVILVYPFLYMTFGYLIAWQNEHLRIYYTGTSEMAPYTVQLASIFGDGLYFLQLVRGSIWIAVTAPVAMMISGSKLRFLLIGVLSSLLPSSLLLIPNPYMPADIAMTHFVETATSNFPWGLAIVWATRRHSV
jgi:hypothetical protein